jgi:hypothetical protein
MDTFKEILACLINCATAAETCDILKLTTDLEKYKQSLEDLKGTSGDGDQSKIYHLEEFGKEFVMDLLDVLRYSGRYR